MTDAPRFRILVPLDGSPLSQQALAYAQALATSPTEVVLLEVIRDPEPVRGPLDGPAVLAIPPSLTPLRDGRRIGPAV